MLIRDGVFASIDAVYLLDDGPARAMKLVELPRRLTRITVAIISLQKTS